MPVDDTAIFPLESGVLPEETFVTAQGLRQQTAHMGAISIPVPKLGFATYSVRVMTDDGKPFVGMVHFVSADFKPVGSKVTDMNGMAIFTAPKGEFYFNVKADASQEGGAVDAKEDGSMPMTVKRTAAGKKGFIEEYWPAFVGGGLLLLFLFGGRKL